ncbi:MAG: CHAT domain-containing protein, partial [Bacteroidetes bacterium]
ILEFELGTEHPDYVVGLYDLGRLYTQMNQPEEAEKTLKKALEFVQLLENSTLLKARILNAMGLLNQQTDKSGAINYFQQALQEYDKMKPGLNPEASQTHLNLAKTWLNKYLKTIENLEENESVGPAIPSLAQVNYEEAMERVTTKEGNILNYQILAEAKAVKAMEALIIYNEDTGILRAALSNCLDAIDHLYRHLNHISGDAAKFKLIEESHFIFEIGLRVAMTLYEKTQEELYAWSAFLICEKSKAIVLSVNKAAMRSPDQNVITRKKAIREVETKLLFAPDDIALHKQLAQKKNDLDDYLDQHPGSSTCQLKAFPRMEEFQTRIDNKSSWLSYFIGKSEYYVFALSDDNFEAVALPLDFRKGTEKKAVNFMTNLNISGKSQPGVYSQLQDKQKNIPLNKSVEGLLNSVRKMEKRKYVLYAHDLYNKLIAPVESALSSKEQLFISPDGALYKIPFETFISKAIESDKKVKFHKLKYLANDYSFEYTYSLTANLETSEEPPSVDHTSFLGLAPVFSNPAEGTRIQSETAYLFDSTFQSDENFRTVLGDELTFAPLDFSSVEITEIGALFNSKGQKAEVLLNEGASENTFKTLSGQFDIIHFATHSFPHLQNPRLSGIALYQPDTKMMAETREDGILYAAEIPTLTLGAQLVVLSSCESSVGPVMLGDGPYSLARSFLEAGAQQVISSLWKIYDNYSQQMMMEFYTNLLEGKSTAEALGAAKLKMIKNKKTANPAIWSGLILMK